MVSKQVQLKQVQVRLSALMQGDRMAAARLSLVSNLFLTGIKIGVGLLTGSVSILAEAAHSLSDLLASALTLVSVRAAERPPDDSHPYGHGKAESLSALAESLLLFLAAGYIVYEAVGKLKVKAGPQRLDWGLAVMATAALVNVFVVRFMFRVARQTGSQALHADAENHRADIYAASGVFVGLLLVRLTGLGIFDPILAIFVSFLILRTAWILAREALAPLMDSQLSPEDVDIVRHALDSDSSVLGYHKLRTRQSGSARFVDAHVLMDDDLTLWEAHELTEGVEERVRALLPNTEVTFHTEPFHAEQRHQQEEHGRRFETERISAAPSPSAACRRARRLRLRDLHELALKRIRPVSAGDFLAVARDIMGDQRTAETVAAGVGRGTVNQAAVEEQHVAGFHVALHGLHPRGNRNVFGRKRDGRVGLLRAGDVFPMGAGNDAHPAVPGVHIVHRQPGRHAGAGLDPQVEIVLVQFLAPRSGGLEVEHGLNACRLLAEQAAQDGVQARVQQEVTGDLAHLPIGMVMRVHHARIKGQRITFVIAILAAPNLRQPFHRAVFGLPHERLTDAGRFFRAEQSAQNNIAIALKLRFLLVG